MAISELVVSLWADDLAAMRDFYISRLGMEEQWFADTPEFGMLVVRGPTFGLMIWRSDEPVPRPPDFAGQAAPGGPKVFGLGLKFEDEASFRQMVVRLDGVRHEPEVPRWYDDSFWQVYALDPMGNTVELFWVPAERPSSPEWTYDVRPDQESRP